MISQEAGEEIKHHTSEVRVQRQGLARVASLNPISQRRDRKWKSIRERNPAERRRRERQEGNTYMHAPIHTHTHTHTQLTGEI